MAPFFTLNSLVKHETCDILNLLDAFITKIIDF